jgi:hypothetical protein
MEHLLWHLERASCSDNVFDGFPKPLKKNNNTADNTTIDKTIIMIVEIGKLWDFINIQTKWILKNLFN